MECSRQQTSQWFHWERRVPPGMLKPLNQHEKKKKRLLAGVTGPDCKGAWAAGTQWGQAGYIRGVSRAPLGMFMPSSNG